MNSTEISPENENFYKFKLNSMDIDINKMYIIALFINEYLNGSPVPDKWKVAYIFIVSSEKKTLIVQTTEEYQ